MEQQNAPAATSGAFRKKPVVIRAVQITDATFDAPHPNPEHIPGIVYDPSQRCAFIDTLEGRMRADLGDWIITGVKGEHYPCKPDIFSATYEPAGDEEAAQAPDATIGITWNGTGFNLSVQRSTDLSQPSAHLADWVARHAQPLSMMAAVDWNAQQALAAQVVQAAQGAQAAIAGDDEGKVETGTLRLVSPHGGPLQ